MSGRLRARSFEMQRGAEELVEMRDRQLRQQLLQAQTELAAAGTPESLREHHTEELAAARQEEAELARANSLLKATSSIQATEKATSDVEVEHVERRIADLTTTLGDQLAIAQADGQGRSEKVRTDEEALPGLDRCLGWRFEENESGYHSAQSAQSAVSF